MTCSRNFRRVLQAGCLGLIGALTVVGCGGSESKPTPDASVDGGPAGVAALSVDKTLLPFGSVDVGSSTTLTLSVTNRGTGLSGVPVVVSSAPTVKATGCTAALAAGASCTLSVVYTPTTALDLVSATLSISATPGTTAGNPIVVAVTGSGTPAGQFTVTPSALTFASVPVGVASELMTIQVVAKAPLVDLAVSLGSASLVLDTSSTCVAALPTGQSCKVVVSYKSSTAGSKSDQVSISAGTKQSIVAISGVVLNPASLVISPTTQSVASQVGVASAPFALNVANQALAPAVASGVPVVTIDDTTDFTLTNGCLVALGATSTCPLTVVFKPATAGVKTAIVTVKDGATTLTATITGTAFSPSLVTITGTTTFPDTILGSTSPLQTLTVTNTGDTATGALAIAVGDAQFGLSNDKCTGISLAKGATCTVSASFSPSKVAAQSSAFTVSNAAGVLVGATLSGNGLAQTGPGQLSVTPPTIDFLSIRVTGTSTATTVTVTNTGATATGALQPLKATGDFAMFPIGSNTCTAVLAPAQSCTFTLSFAPTDSAPASKSAVYTITDGTLSATVTVQGVALANTGISIVPTPSSSTDVALQTFSDIVVNGSETVDVYVKAASLPAGATDTGAITASIKKADGTASTDFSILTNGCTSPLTQGTFCKLTLQFQPGSAGALSAVLNVTTANGGLANATLQGNGLPIMQVYACTGAAGACPVTPAATLANLSTAVADLDFGAVSLNATTGVTKKFRTIVRGPTGTGTTPPTNAVTVVLVDPATTGANFSNADGATVNFCNGATLTITGATQGQTVTATGGGTWTYATAYQGYYCDSQVKFLPQGTVKEKKTATLTAAGSGAAGGSSALALTGTASGPLTIVKDPASPGLPALVTVGDSTNHDPVSGPNLNLLLDVKNSSTTVALTPVAISLTAGADQYEIVANDCGQSIAASATCHVTIAFSPTGAAGAKTGTLTVTAGAETATYDISGNAAQNVVTLTPAGTTAAPVAIATGLVIGNSSAWQLFTITNPATAPKTDQISWGLVTASTHFFIDGNQGTTPCGVSGVTSLDPGKTCTIGVQFKALTGDLLTTPATVLTDTLRVHVNGLNLDSVVSGTPATNLAVTSAQATKTVGTVTAYDFGDVAQSATTAAVTLTVANLSGAAISAAISTAAAGNFAIVTGGTCGATAALGAAGSATASCTVAVNFTGRTGVTLPHQEGTAPDAAVRSIVFSDGTSTATASLTARTVRPANLQVVGLASTPVVADLGSMVNPNQSAPATFTFQNTGDVPATTLQFLWSTVGGDITCPASADPRVCDPFQVVAETPGCFQLASLAPLQTCTVSIVSKPSNSVTAGAKTIHFTLSADGGIAVTTQFQLITTVRRADAITNEVYFDYGSPVSYGLLSFLGATGRTAVGASSAQSIVTIENKTGGALVLPAPADTAAWAALVVAPGTTAPTLDFVVAPAGPNPCTASLGTSCTLGVTFTPQAGTNVFRYASLRLANALVNTLGLVGEVKSLAILAITPSPVDFGSVLAGTSATLTATVTNSGQTDATGLTINNGLPAVFNVTGCTGTVAANGGTCTLTVVAVAPAAGSGVATTAPLSVTPAPATGAPSSAVTMSITSVLAASLAITDVSAGGANPGSALTVVDANTQAYDFGTTVQTVGGVVGNHTVTLRITNPNTQTTGPLTIGLAGNTDSFTLDTTGCAAAATAGLVGGTFCNVLVTFNPVSHAGATVPGDLTTALSVSATPGAATAKVVNITGHSKSALGFFAADGTTALPVSPAVAVTVSATAPGTVIKVKNSLATATGLLSTAGISGADAASFSITTNTCLFNALPSTEADNTCSIVVQYTGGTTTTAKTTTLTVSDGTTQNTKTLALTYGP